MSRRTNALVRQTGKYLDQVLDEDVHAARVASLADATVGVLESRALAIRLIGQGLATCRGLDTKHAIKQVDRLLSNVGVKFGSCLKSGYPTWCLHALMLS